MIMNTLARETSPYLLQHAANPVAWQAWSTDAIAFARREQRPILLSIGYAACHWCHVMAHESFADEATAALMNRLYVNIKVDREERPDLDRVYQLAHQIVAGRSGGWPLTVFLDPDTLTPFFSGTYFPPEPRHGLPAFRVVLERVADYFKDHRDDIAAQREELVGLLAAPEGPAAERLDSAPLDMARHQLAHAWDRKHGGFGGAPKFPQPGHIDRLLRHGERLRRQGSGDDEATAMAVETLAAMASGGLYDQIGGGFFRYCVDEHWEIPHFEKMLYDNGLLLALYAQAFALTRRPLFARVVDETVAWLEREMRGPAGGFHSSLDADTEGHEGRYYVWPEKAFADTLPDDEAASLRLYYGLDGPPNFEGHSHHLRVVRDTGTVAAALGFTPDRCAALIAAGRKRLFECRMRRTPPSCDDKVLTAWNALAIRGLALVARHVGNPRALVLARSAADCLMRELWHDGRLRVSWRAGRAPQPAFLDDHAYLADALFELVQIEWKSTWFDFARRLADEIMERFRDPDGGGFFLTAHDHETLIHRPRVRVDDALPAGAGVAARVLNRLAIVCDEPAYAEAAREAVAAATNELGQTPMACNALLTALEELLEPPELVVIRGQAAELDAWRQITLAPYAPQRLVFAIANEATDLPPGLARHAPMADGRTVAHVCRGMRCEAPVMTSAALARMLDGREVAS